MKLRTGKTGKQEILSSSRQCAKHALKYVNNA